MYLHLLKPSRSRWFGILLSGLTLNAAASPPKPPEGFQWQLNPAFSDEFDGATLDTGKWHDHHPRWRGRPPAKFVPEAVSVKDGRMQIRNRMLDKPDGRFTIGGGAVVSKSQDALYGYYECRMKASSISMSSTFWMSNRGKKTKNGRLALELDIQETVGGPKRARKKDRTMSFNTHVWLDGKSHAKGGHADVSPPTNEAFHTYGAWWVDAMTIHFYCDDKHVGTIRPDTRFSSTPFDQPMHLNMVTETYDWETPPTPEEVNNPKINTTYYDWVRAYTLVPAKKPFLKDPDHTKTWILDQRFSDEFNADRVNQAKWQKKMRPWGERAWSPDNVTQRDGSLFIRAVYEPHTHQGTKYFYKLGILQSLQKTTYGYFEARIKGCRRFPGLCPAFWLYSNGPDRNPDYPNVTYCEIDIVEMLQGIYHPHLKTRGGPNHIDCNLHTRLIDENGTEVWRRPNSLPEVCRHHWTAPWDPRDDYHVYACENTPEQITWFIDGQKVAEEKNLYWHLPMNVTLTMELRPPFIDWEGVDGRVPVPGATTAKGFPTEVAVDYVRCWTREEK